MVLPPDNATGNFTKIVRRVPVKIVLDDSTAAGALRRDVRGANHRYAYPVISADRTRTASVFVD